MEYRQLTDSEYKDLESRILYEDNHILIVNKKVGEIVQGDKTGDETLGDKYKAFIAIRDAKPGKVFLGIPHRIDRPVSGITVLAKTSKALERLSEMFRQGDVHKTYWALVCAAPFPESGELDDWLVRNERMNKTFVVREAEKEELQDASGKDASGKDASGKDDPAPNATLGKGVRKEARLARLTYKMIGKTDRYFLVEVHLLTGRHHQIRCQLSHIGCPIKGDLKYGAPRSNKDGGICLLARNIRFVHPIKKTDLDITAPVPRDWKGLSDL